MDEPHGDVLLFETACEPFNLAFTASVSCMTEGDPRPLLSLTMQPGDTAYWLFEDAEEPEALADKTDALQQWLDDLGAVTAYLTALYEGIPVEKVRG
ncbi:hypothetical protein [Bifidobacterium stellenboschense]|uniref:Uncharacterized protein n=1 Tax=Bifidobacterium stellenboschense TaxID=762211 RepID=A0A087DMX8_9BIFI|nr:hypothetical protein [Bifidobacterium stellenboschense]KFI96878.1 hypothetical protein BSTEL_1787 [Bifidobacterium stellenboschense]